jgi:hypothetical protein
LFTFGGESRRRFQPNGERRVESFTRPNCTTPSSSTSRLDRPATSQEVDDKDDERDDEQNVYQPAADVSDQPEQPKHKQDNKNRPKHPSTLPCSQKSKISITRPSRSYYRYGNRHASFALWRPSAEQLFVIRRFIHGRARHVRLSPNYAEA